VKSNEGQNVMHPVEPDAVPVAESSEGQNGISQVNDDMVDTDQKKKISKHVRSLLESLVGRDVLLTSTVLRGG
jgi:hypothetical protein